MMNANHRHSNPHELDEARLTAYALDQLDEEERAAVEAQLAGLDPESADKLRRSIEQTRALGGHLLEASGQQPRPEPSPALRAAVERRLAEMEDSPMSTTQDARSAQKRRHPRRLWLILAVTAAVLIAAVPIYLFIPAEVGREPAEHVAMVAPHPASLPPPVHQTEGQGDRSRSQGLIAQSGPIQAELTAEEGAKRGGLARLETEKEDLELHRGSGSSVSSVRQHSVLDDMYGAEDATAAYGSGAHGMAGTMGGGSQPTGPGMTSGSGVAGPGPGMGTGAGGYPGSPGAAAPADAASSMYAAESAQEYSALRGGGAPADAGDTGAYSPPPASPTPAALSGAYHDATGGAGMGMPGMGAPHGGSTPAGSASPSGPTPAAYPGMPGGDAMDGTAPMYGGGYPGGMGFPGGQPATPGQAPQGRTPHEAVGSVAFSPDGRQLASGSGDRTAPMLAGRRYGHYYYEDNYDAGDSWRRVPSTRPAPAPGTEQYDAIVENEFLPVGARPLSTFSIDVDTASYANVRRFLTDGRLPPPDAVRVEEMVNYFRYDYPPPEDEVPFSVNMEVTQCPWRAEHRLLRIGLKGREVEREQRGPSNLVFLLDVSGSMRDENKLPLVKQAMRLLVDQLTEDDRVGIVTYASSAGLQLESTCASDRQKILDAIDSLSAGGSTHGSAGIQLAYQQAEQHFVEEGTNRVILATDGDLNVGITDDDELVKLIRKKAKSGVFLTVLGFGTGNLKDSKMEKLADHGNGIYAYVDNLREARKVLIEQVSGSLVTIAKDVKIQIEFNPAEVEAYRLIGYENRMLAARDFDNDKKDAGEIGAGHTVTALYELVPAGREPAVGEDGPMLKYQRPAPPPAGELTDEAQSGELLTLRLRYKEPDGNQSKLLEFVTKDPGKRFGQASPDFQFAAAVAAFGMVLRGSRYAGDLTLEAVEEFAVSGMGNDPGGYRAEFVDLIRRARGLRGH